MNHHVHLHPHRTKGIAWLVAALVCCAPVALALAGLHQSVGLLKAAAQTFGGL
jgi:hypothetical protein